MKNSPLQLSSVRYSDVVVRAVPDISGDRVVENLPVHVDASIFYNLDGEHYATVDVSQKDDSYPYVLEISAFGLFSIDAAGCREAYKQQFNPYVVGVNVARMIYSSARDLIATITARAPYETANVPTLIIEPADISVHFESGEERTILQRHFGLSEEQLDQLDAARTRIAEEKKQMRKSTKKTSKIASKGP